MILSLFLALQVGPVAPVTVDPAQKRFEACAALVKSDPAKAVAEAEAWRNGGGLPAKMCLGLAYSAQERWGPAAIAFEQAAKEAGIQRDGRAANLWVQAGNAALAGDDPAMARNHFDRALALPVLSDEMRGETHLDRARADVAIGNLGDARADLDRAVKLVPGDPMAWLLSATLARRQNDLPRATRDINEAARLAPQEAPVAFEQGNIAQLAGRTDEAKAAWTRAATLAPESDAGQAAILALKGGAPQP
ncbi:Tetratricopeptide repeat-containing protein [Sphingomonas laterariae]|uniref:Tetratricopeptide repeat-containing protein n=1 Tax=Edaphosphingomonas laterariae TaxID=861865 RepID=A0A239FPP7_9SPHN|nr:tetratricopeptide repeat protein [Sphingomonas laterariae]SNS57894.1 Tetratricopeptide repeat-containing protein [Sphingomonas laterariae]